MNKVNKLLLNLMQGCLKKKFNKSRLTHIKRAKKISKSL